MTKHAPFRFDTVGSFLRSENLKQAREEYEKGNFSYQELKNFEDAAIRDLVKKEIEAGYKGITDGEFRRAYWHLDFFWGLGGIKHVQAKTGYQFHDEVTKPDSATVVGTIHGRNHPFVAHYTFLRDLVADNDEVEARITIPSPSQLYFELIRDEEHVEQLNSVYSNFDDVVADISKAYLEVIQQLFDEGLRTLQVDDCTWGILVDDNFLTLWGQGRDKEEVRRELAATFLRLNNAVYKNVPEGLVVNTHVCRGNFHSTWAASGGYASVAEELFEQEEVNAYYLEFDTDRAGDFTPLAKVSGDKKVVLGLVTSKFGELESKEELISRIKEASQYIPLERLSLSTQCGFASTEEGNILTEEQQWAKLALIKEVAEEVWGTENE